MINFILIFVCIIAGITMSQLKVLPADSHKSVNAWLIYVALPALALRFVPDTEWNMKLLLPVLGPVLVWLGACLFIRIYDWKKQLPHGSRTALLIACGLGNTAFIGFPMVSAFYGESEIHHAVVFDQLTFILFSTVGVIAILKSSSGEAKKISLQYIVRKIFRFPPFIACLLALILPCFFDISSINPFLDKLVATMSPLALFSIGLQLRLGEIRKEWRLISAGMLYKLLLAPCLVMLLAFLIKSNGNMTKISIFEAGMSSHITASLLASQYKLNPSFSSLMVGASIVFGFISSTCWYFVLQYLF
ncbi:MAG: AEC family transporter [Dysgonamonadaceae bacterium]|jgi:predicted permease|nr:AEC family transporter [Dysgonamonadaceae bacterium]